MRLASFVILLAILCSLYGGESSTVSRGALDTNSIAQARSGHLERAIEGQELRYLMSLPEGWTPDRKWPLLVVVTGSNGNFPVLAEGYRSIRGPLPFVLATPMTVSSTKSESIDAKRYPHLSEERRVALAATARQDLLAQDLAGIEALIKDLSTHAATEDRCYLSGFSMGGFLAWHAAFRRPDLLHAILPSCPCFDPASVPDRIPDGFTSLPILVLQGQQDTLLEKVLEPAWMQAKAAVAKANHLGVLRLMTVRNHSWHYEEIQQFCYGHVLARTTSRR